MKKVGSSIVGVIIGIICLIGGTGLLWWNEGNNVKNIKTVDEISDEVVEVDSDEVDKANDGKLVLTSGKLVASNEVNDYVFKVSVTTPLLKRKVEMYQWEEEVHTDSKGNKTYTYNKVWSDEAIDSTNFKENGHRNSAMSYKSDTMKASFVKLGSFSLSTEQIEGLSTDKELSLATFKPINNFSIDGKYMTNSKNLKNPNIGDIRVSWTYNDWEEVTVLAVQKNNSFETYTSKSDKKVNRVEKGKLSSREVIDKIINENKILKWSLRGAGLLIIFIGYLLLSGPLSTIASFVPIFGNIVGALLGLVSFLIGLVHSLIVIAIAWVRFRPIIAISLLVGAILLFIISKKIAKKKAL